MKSKIKNLFSRKFILSALIVIGGIGTSLKTIDNPTVQIVGVAVACVAACVYAYVEGQCDIEAIKKNILDALDKYQEIKEKEENENE